MTLTLPRLFAMSLCYNAPEGGCNARDALTRDQ
jgi:hypothetical protein